MNKDGIIKDYYIEPAKVPVVNFQLLNSSNKAERHAAIELLDAAFREWGFVYISNHSISSEKVDLAFEWSRRFFAQSSETKELIAHPPSGEIDDNRGWAKTGLGHTVQMVFDADEAEEFRQKNPDYKETLELGNPFSDEVPPNRWLPDHLLPGFKNFVESWWTDCATLAHSLYGSVGEALKLRNEDYFCRIHSKDDCHMTWNFYPSMRLQALHSADAKRLNAHTDFGTLTIVFQDAVGGLEVHDGHMFRPIVPIPGAVVVNVGDMLEQQSNGQWKSALHRVVGPANLMKPGSVQDGDQDNAIDRYSLVYFGVPNPSEKIEIAPGCEEPGKWKPNMSGDWGKLSARQWIEKRLAVEY
ncbi:2OG-Fe(II) oxygenase superfamily protein [Talaromyces proteolyticus]|uniref:2OG-Fe(II) oxygenase superfamily protein n=1 Tax=Talaromyces proteolyticus TaxID=1131652 RepID=A0AAD4KT88_9EURO|nr:2OG-Fe(II) oxygenase superfamily protein [Talaromyces proteolyticus]KAH8698798.1 2OG-Fe(II) oxygenase superfamily protein [Talaromyces proteolyticus]